MATTKRARRPAGKGDVCNVEPVTFAEVGAVIRSIFNCPTLQEIDAELERMRAEALANVRWTIREGGASC